MIHKWWALVGNVKPVDMATLSVDNLIIKVAVIGYSMTNFRALFFGKTAMNTIYMDKME